MSTVKGCLKSIGVQLASLEACVVLTQEWSLIKKSYFKKILKCHPDKGGDAAEFSSVRSAFEGLRLLFDRGAVVSFATALDNLVVDDVNGNEAAADKMPSWEYYAEAASEAVPGYRIELAKSSRSCCNATGSGKQCDDDTILQNAIRIGRMDKESGSYGRFVHLCCWRVPSKVWLGLPDSNDIVKIANALLSMNEVLLDGMTQLDKGTLREVATHVMDKSNWAKQIRAKAPLKPSSATGASSFSGPASSALVPSTASSAMVTKRVFVLPRPGVDARPNSMNGFVVTLTGIFPEVGGGTGLNIGAERVTNTIQSFGGKVTSQTSGKTDILLCGKEPGFVTITKARRTNKIRLMSLQDLKEELHKGRVEIGEHSLAVVPPLYVMGGGVSGFSAGYHGNSVPSGADKSALDFARYGVGSIQGTKFKEPIRKKEPAKRPLALHGSDRGAASPSVGRASPSLARASPSVGRTPAAKVPGKASFTTPAKPPQGTAAPPALPAGWRKCTHKKTGEVQFLGPDGKRYKKIPQNSAVHTQGFKRKDPASSVLNAENAKKVCL